jgi:hypothetical protein
MVSKIRLSWPMVCGSGLLLLVSGCGQNVGDMASSVKDAASRGVDQAKQAAGGVAETARGTSARLAEKAGLAGEFDLHVGQPLKTDACYVQLIALGPDRPAVLQLQSCRDPVRESFPSVFLRAEVAAADFPALVGQTVEAQLFVKPLPDAPTLHSRDAPVQLRIDALGEDFLSGEIIAGSLSGPGQDSPIPVSGSFRGMVQ